MDLVEKLCAYVEHLIAENPTKSTAIIVAVLCVGFTIEAMLGYAMGVPDFGCNPIM